MRTQVAIVGAGPAGLLLARLLHLRGVESVVLEARSREHVESRVRAGVLEQPSVELLRAAGTGARLDREGLTHRGMSLRFDRGDHRIAFDELAGRTITVYGQQEVVKDLIAARLADGGAIEFGVSEVRLHDLGTGRPAVSFVDATGAARRVDCAVVAGCDGFHGVSRDAVPTAALTVREHGWPYAWLGVLARATPASDELIYARSERGFALCSMRSPEITRLYLQVDPHDDVARWPADRLWDELAARLAVDDGPTVHRGEILDVGITGMRSFVASPLRHGRLFLAGDAAHIVPPTGAKGMNLAIADVALLAPAIAALLRGDDEPAAAWSDTALRRVWRTQQFSWSMTTMLHRDPAGDAFADELQLARLRHVAGSRAAATDLAEHYTGLPFDAAAALDPPASRTTIDLGS